MYSEGLNGGLAVRREKLPGLLESMSPKRLYAHIVASTNIQHSIIINSEYREENNKWCLGIQHATKEMLKRIP